MSKLICTSVFTSVMLLALGNANATLYTGSLQYSPPFPADSNDGLYVGPSNLQWAGYTVTLDWTVTDTDNSQPGFPWKYTYHLSHNGTQAGYSHMIIEASPSLTAANVAGVSNGSLNSVTTQFNNGGNPNMPENLYGIKLDPPTSGIFDWTVSFFSDRAPVWGDFYARCGGQQGGINYVYNYNNTAGVEKGFLPSDTDPTVPPSNGSVDFHILRPDSSTVPEPGTLALLACGLVGLLVARRRIAR